MTENKIPLYAEIDRLRDERDGFRNGQQQMQAICSDLQDAIQKYADERKRLRAENALLVKLNDSFLLRWKSPD